MCLVEVAIVGDLNPCHHTSQVRLVLLGKPGVADLHPLQGRTGYAAIAVEVGNQPAVGTEVLHVPGRVAVMSMLSELEVVAELDLQVGATVDADDRAGLTLKLYLHAQPCELNASAANHVCDELFFLSGRDLGTQWITCIWLLESLFCQARIPCSVRATTPCSVFEPVCLLRLTPEHGHPIRPAN